MIGRAALLATATLALLAIAAPAPAAAAGEECELDPITRCFGLESVVASLSSSQPGVAPTQAGAHPNLSFTFDIKKNPESAPNVFGLKDGYATTRNVRIELPPGLIGDPNALGAPQQCTVEGLSTFNTSDGGCPNGSQIGTSKIFAYDLDATFPEPVYMMVPPGGDVVARVGLIAGVFPTFIDFKVRSESDYGLTAEITDAPAAARLIRAETTTWGVPAAHAHDNERCTAIEALNGCVTSPSRPPGSRELPFFTNPTRCGVPLQMSVNASSWVEPEFLEANRKSASFPEITGCNHLPFGPSLTVEPTSHHAASPTGADVTIRLPAANGVNVLEPSQMRAVRVKLPEGFAFNPSAGDGLATCSKDQVHLGEPVAAACPDASKLADTEFDIPVLERNLKGAVYLREPEPGHPFRIWITADDLGLHVKLEGELEVDKSTGQVTEVTTEIPQAPVREAKLEFKSGLRAPLVTPDQCGTYLTEYEFVPWSGRRPVVNTTPMKIDEGCDTGGFAPKLSAGAIDPAGGQHSPFLFTLTREDGEQNPRGLDISLPTGLVATFSGLDRCLGAAAQTGACPAGSRIGHVSVAVGAGPSPLWVPQAGKRPTAIYLGGPYKGAPTSIVAVVPRQAGPFDFGDEVVRSAVYVDPDTARATAKADPLPQLIEGIPIGYRAVHVELDRENFTLNPTSCAPKETVATVTSSKGTVARPSSPFEAVNCAKLGFRPKLSFHLRGGTQRGGHPRLQAVVKARPGDANIAGAVVALPHSEFLDQGHIGTVCTRVQFAAHQCPEAAIYGNVVARSPLFDETLSGPVYLRSSSHLLPDVVAVLRGPDTFPIEVDLDGRVDSVHGGIRNTFELIPDAPVTSFVLTLKSGKKGLLENSTNLCARTKRATAEFTAQNGRRLTLHPQMQADCGKHKRHGRAPSDG